MTSRLNEDEVLTALLFALEDLHNIRNEMHSSIKQVSFGRPCGPTTKACKPGLAVVLHVFTR